MKAGDVQARAARRGNVIYDNEHGHVCTCTEMVTRGECDGHPAGPFDPMGVTVYCDGTCADLLVSYENTVHVNRSVEPTESGSYWYDCDRCGAGAWSGL
jgi:hypothetical protein